MTLREVNIKEIKEAANFTGSPLPEFDDLSNHEIARLWMEFYESYPFLFDVC